MIYHLYKALSLPITAPKLIHFPHSNHVLMMQTALCQADWEQKVSIDNSNKWMQLVSLANTNLT